MWTIFHVWSGAYGESRRTRGSTKGKSRGGTRENHSTNKESITQVLDHHTHMRYTRSKVNKGKDTKEPFFSERRP